MRLECDICHRQVKPWPDGFIETRMVDDEGQEVGPRSTMFVCRRCERAYAAVEEEDVE